MAKRLLQIGFAVFAAVFTLQLVLPFTSVILSQTMYVPAQSRTEISGEVEGASTDTTRQSVSAYLKAWEKQTGVQFTTDPGYSSNANYTWKVASKSKHQNEIAYYQSFDYEIAKYSRQFLTESGLKRIILVDDIKTHSSEAVLGFADILTGELYLNIDGSRAQSALIKSTIHHEIAHIMFYQAHGADMYSLSDWPANTNSGASSASYSKGNSFPSIGYVSTYAKTSIAEDMAEVFAYAMTDEYRNDLMIASREDDQIRKKIELVEESLRLVDAEFILPV